MYLRKIKKIASFVLASTLLLSAPSCMKLEMRDSGVDSDNKATQESEATPLMLSQATKKNEIETAPLETEAVKAEETKETITLSVSGRVVMDNDIISDAGNRATDGKSYSFLRMYTGIYRDVSSADIAFCSYSTEEEVQSPIESIGALYDLGFDVINTEDSYTADYLSEYSLIEVREHSECVVLENNGLNIAVLSIDGADCADKSYASDIEYADFVSDLVMVFVDWDDTTDVDKQTVMYDVASAGADIIIGNGDKLGKIDWIDTGDGSLTLGVESLGNILSSGDEINELCGGVLNLSISYGNGSIEISDVLLAPTVTYYTSENAEENSAYQIFTCDGYSDELSSNHAVVGVTADSIKNCIRKVIDGKFLPDYLR